MKQWSKRINHHNNEKGAVLPVVIMLLVVISILGLSIMGLAVNNMKMSSGERDYQSAYYIAESGINIEMNVIKAKVPVFYKSSILHSDFFYLFESEFVNKAIPDIDNFDEKIFGNTPKAKIKIERIVSSSLNPFSSDYKITSTGIIGIRSRSVSKILHLTWNPKSNISINSDTALYLQNTLDWHNTPATITGTVGLGEAAYTKFTGTKSPQIKNYGNLTINSPEFPNFSIPTGSSAFSGSLLTMDRDMYFSQILINGTLEINVGNNNRNIILDTLNISQYGKLKISGTGNLTLYVKKIIMGTNSVINTDKDISKLNIFLEGTANQTSNENLVNNGIIYGSLFAKNLPQNVDLIVDDTSGVQGSLIAGGSGKIVLNNATPAANLKWKMIFAPLAVIDAKLNFNGMIIASEFNSNGNNHGFIFSQPPANPPFFIDNGSINLSSDSLISPEPLREN